MCLALRFCNFSLLFMSVIPDLPGDPVLRNSDQERWLKSHVGRLCHTDSERYVLVDFRLACGSLYSAQLSRQSANQFHCKRFDKARISRASSLAVLSSFTFTPCFSFWVCEKSDGVRVLLLVLTNPATGEQTTFIVSTACIPQFFTDNYNQQIDRHNTYRQLSGLYFPHHENPMNPLMDTLVDGELVVDVDSRTKQVPLFFSRFSIISDGNVQETLRYLAFDCLVADNQNVMSKPLDKRCGVCPLPFSTCVCASHSLIFLASECMVFQTLRKNDD